MSVNRKPKAAAKEKAVIPTIMTDRICVTTRDEQGILFGVVSLSRSNVLDVTYSAINHTLGLTLVGNFGNGETRFEPCRNFKATVTSDGKVKKEALNTFSMQQLYFQNNYNPTLNIADEAEMEKVWKWLRHDESDISWASLMELRKEVTDRVAKAKQEAEAKSKAEAEQRQEEQNKAAALVDEHGNAIKKDMGSE